MSEMLVDRVGVGDLECRKLKSVVAMVDYDGMFKEWGYKGFFDKVGVEVNLIARTNCDYICVEIRFVGLFDRGWRLFY